MYTVVSHRPDGLLITQQATSLEVAFNLFNQAKDCGNADVRLRDSFGRRFSEDDIARRLHERAGASTSTFMIIEASGSMPIIEGTRLRTAAILYLSAARRLGSDGSDVLNQSQSPQYLLVSQSIELSLKAFLLRHGVDEDTAKREFGHDLYALYEEAKSLGLALHYATAERDIFWLNEWHMTAGTRYEFTEVRALPICSTLFPLAQEVIDRCA